MTRDELKEVGKELLINNNNFIYDGYLEEAVKDLLINNIILDSYVDYDGNATPEIDHDKTVDGIINDLEKERVLFEVDA